MRMPSYDCLNIAYTKHSCYSWKRLSNTKIFWNNFSLKFYTVNLSKIRSKNLYQIIISILEFVYFVRALFFEYFPTLKKYVDSNIDFCSTLSQGCHWINQQQALLVIFSNSWFWKAPHGRWRLIQPNGPTVRRQGTLSQLTVHPSRSERATLSKKSGRFS